MKSYAADSPKTSEYKYYKKLLRDTGSTFCYPSDKPDKHLKKFEAIICKASMLSTKIVSWFFLCFWDVKIPSKF